MTKTIKRTIVAILLLCIAISFACFAACGKTPDESSNENQQEQQTNVENNQTDENSSEDDNLSDIVLSLDGKSVVGLKDRNLTHLTILPSYNDVTVTGINDYAFSECTSLVSVTIPDTVTYIGECAFSDCISLVSVTIGKSVTYIGEDAFEDCHKLIEVINKSNLDISKGDYDNGYIGCYALNVKTEGESEIVNKDNYLFYTVDNVNYLFGYVGNETSLTLPANYNGQNYVIYKYTFYNCDSLVSVTIPNSVTSIGIYAFA